MSTRMDALMAERAAANAVLAETRQALQKARRQERQRAAAQARQWELQPHQRYVALIAYVFAGYDAEPAARFLAVDGERRRWQERPEEELCLLAEDVFLETDLEELVRLCDTESPGEPRATEVAVRYVEEWRLVVWARSRSERPVGAPPTTGAVLREAEANRLQIPAAIRPPSLGLVCDMRARLWAFRWRERWGGHHGELPIRPPFSAEGGRPKVFGVSEGWRV